MVTVIVALSLTAFVLAAIRYRRRSHPDVSRAWLRCQARQETTQGWSGAVRWRSPAEIRQLGREEREQQRLAELRNKFGWRESA